MKDPEDPGKGSKVSSPGERMFLSSPALSSSGCLHWAYTGMNQWMAKHGYPNVKSQLPEKCKRTKQTSQVQLRCLCNSIISWLF